MFEDVHQLSATALALGPERARNELVPFLNDTEYDTRSACACADALGDFVEYIGGPEYAHTLIVPLEELATRQDPITRSKAVQSLNKVCEQLSETQTQTYFVPLLMRLSQTGFQVSKISAVQLYAIPYVKATPTSQELLRQEFVTLLYDPLVAVRIAAIGRMAGFCGMLDRETMVDMIRGFINNLTMDISESVRVAVAIQICHLAPMLGRERTIKYLIPSFLLLLKDGSFLVRLNFISRLDLVDQVMGLDLLLQPILSAVRELGKDEQSSVRSDLIKSLSFVVTRLGPEYVIPTLSPLIMKWLGDPASTVREATLENIDKFVHTFGILWAQRTLIPVIWTMGENSIIWHRTTACQAIGILAPVIDLTTIKSILPLVRKLMGDDVVDVRLGITKANNSLLAALKQLPQGGEQLATEVEQHATQSNKNLDGIERIIANDLAKLQQDDDEHVRELAPAAITNITSLPRTET